MTRKGHAAKAYEGEELELHSFLTSSVVVDERSISGSCHFCSGESTQTATDHEAGWTPE